MPCSRLSGDVQELIFVIEPTFELIEFVFDGLEHLLESGMGDVGFLGLAVGLVNERNSEGVVAMAIGRWLGPAGVDDGLLFRILQHEVQKSELRVSLHKLLISRWVTRRLNHNRRNSKVGETLNAIDTVPHQSPNVLIKQQKFGNVPILKQLFHVVHAQCLPENLDSLQVGLVLQSLVELSLTAYSFVIEKKLNRSGSATNFLHYNHISTT